MHRALRSAVIGVHIGTVSASVFILLAITALATSGQSRPTNSAPPSGLVVVIENRPQGTLNLQALKNPSISGVALQIRWRDIEPVKGQTDWSKLDQLFAAAEWSNKWVQLLIFPGFFLRLGLWKARRRKCSRYSMARAKALWSGFRCHGTRCTWVIGSIS